MRLTFEYTLSGGMTVSQSRHFHNGKFVFDNFFRSLRPSFAEKQTTMPDRELRRMRRAELVEIILALKQTEDRLRAENAALSAQLQERQIHIENAGSIAQAALELNNVFAAAQAAADDYLHSVQASLADTNATAANTLSQARSEAKRILEQAQADADSLKAQAQQECDTMTADAAQKRTQTEADCKAMVERAEQEVQQRWQTFDRKANDLLDQYRSTDGLPSEET